VLLLIEVPASSVYCDLVIAYTLQDQTNTETALIPWLSWRKEETFGVLRSREEPTLTFTQQSIARRPGMLIVLLV